MEAAGRGSSHTAALTLQQRFQKRYLSSPVMPLALAGFAVAVHSCRSSFDMRFAGFDSRKMYQWELMSKLPIEG